MWVGQSGSLMDQWVLPTLQQQKKSKTFGVRRWRHAGPKRANQGTRMTERGQVKEGEDEEPSRSDCGEQIGEVAGLQPQHLIRGTCSPGINRMRVLQCALSLFGSDGTWNDRAQGRGLVSDGELVLLFSLSRASFYLFHAVLVFSNKLLLNWHTEWKIITFESNRKNAEKWENIPPEKQIWKNEQWINLLVQVNGRAVQMLVIMLRLFFIYLRQHIVLLLWCSCRSQKPSHFPRFWGRELLLMYFLVHAQPQTRNKICFW